MLGYTLTEMQWWTGVGGNQAPTCSISLPVDGTTYAFGQQVVFTGAASDPEDGTLMGNSILWSSTIDGNLGNGSPGNPTLYFATTGLSAGIHTIRLTATDSQGATAFATVGITITVANTPPVTTIILPSNATVWNQGSVLTCTATCTDFQQGVITGAANVKWSSSRAGAFGPGTH